jgi:hypothetical protein
MPRPIAMALIVAAGGMTLAGPAHPRQYHHINPIPFWHTPCSVLDEGPCTPHFCGVYSRWPCIPEIDYPYGENLQLTVETVPEKRDAAKYQRPDHDLNTIGDLFSALRSCWTAPDSGGAREGMQMAVRFSFKKSGDLIGPPRITFATAGVPTDTRATYLKAINASLEACLPLKFTSALGGAIAGRPIMVRYVDNRDLGKTSSENK